MSDFMHGIPGDPVPTGDSGPAEDDEDETLEGDVDEDEDE